MATPATSNIRGFKSITAGDTDLPRGVRAVLNTSGTYDLAGIGVRGDVITGQFIPSGTVGIAASINEGGSIGVVASETVAVDDTAYSAANGQTSKTATNAVIMGKWKQVSSSGKLGIIELQPIL